MATRKSVDADTTVYSAAAWWQDGDPSMQAVALTPKRAEREIDKMMKSAARDARDDGSYRSISDALEDIGWSGVHSFRLGELAGGRERALEQARRALEEDGVWYPET